MLCILHCNIHSCKISRRLEKHSFSCRSFPTDKYRKNVPVAVIFQREILCKLASCFFICLPLLFGKEGGHEASTHTKLRIGKGENSWKKNKTIFGSSNRTFFARSTYLESRGSISQSSNPLELYRWLHDSGDPIHV